MTSGLRNVRLSTVVIISALTTTPLLPLISSINDNAFLQSQSVFAQVQEEEEEGQVDFLPYDNPTHGIFIQYPSDWTASTSGLEDYTDLIAFYSPLQNVSELFPTRFKISVTTFNQTVSLPEYTNLVWTMLNQSGQGDVKSSSEVTVAGYPGHMVVLGVTPFQNNTLTFYEMATWTAVGNKVYFLTYEAEESTFNKHLPDVSRMIESLSISSNEETAIED